MPGCEGKRGRGSASRAAGASTSGIPLGGIPPASRRKRRRSSTPTRVRWELPHHGEATPECGESKWLGHELGDGDACSHLVRHDCQRRGCPSESCSWEKRDARDMTHRLVEGMRRVNRHVAIHLTVSGPQDGKGGGWAVEQCETLEGFDDYRKACHEVAKEAGLEGGVWVFHYYRMPRSRWCRKDGERQPPGKLRAAPHLHYFGTGWIQACRATSSKDWIWWNLGVRKSIFVSLVYALSHATVARADELMDQPQRVAEGRPGAAGEALHGSHGLLGFDSSPAAPQGRPSFMEQTPELVEGRPGAAGRPVSSEEEEASERGYPASPRSDGVGSALEAPARVLTKAAGWVGAFGYSVLRGVPEPPQVRWCSRLCIELPLEHWFPVLFDRPPPAGVLVAVVPAGTWTRRPSAGGLERDPWVREAIERSVFNPARRRRLEAWEELYA